MDAFIDDGYTETVGIEAVDGLHPSMEFTYRPFAGNEVAETFRRIQLGPTAMHRDPRKRKPEKIRKEQTEEAIEERLLDVIIARVDSWSFTGRPIDRANLRRMKGKLFEKFHNIIFAFDTPDYRVGDDGDKEEAAEDQAEQDAGNSPAESTS